MRIGLGIGLNRFRGGQAGDATGILDSYTGAAFAFAPDVLIYSAHSVTDSAVGSATNGQTGQYTVRVRRSSDNAVSSFTYTEVSDGTLTTWVGAGNDGFVEAAYDQSGNGNHATQATAANQPKIVDAGSLVVENGKAAFQFDGIDDYFSNGIFQSYNTAYTEIAVAKNTSTAVATVLIAHNDGSSSQPGYLGTRNSGSDWGTFDGSNRIFGSTTSGEIDLITRLKDGTNIESYVNSINGANYTSNSATTPSIIGVITVSPIQLAFEGNASFLLFYGSNQSTNRAAIETAINNEYNIYP